MSINKPSDVTSFNESQISTLTELFDALYREAINVKYTKTTPTTSNAAQNELVVLDDDAGDVSLNVITSQKNLLTLTASDSDSRFNITTGHDHDGTDSKLISYDDLTDVAEHTQVYTSGNNTWTVPTGVTLAWVTASGGGGGGGNDGTGGDAGGGGGGASIINKAFTVSGTLTANVGAAGTGGVYGAGSGGNGGAGGTTTVGSMAIPGGSGGTQTTTGASGGAGVIDGVTTVGGIGTFAGGDGADGGGDKGGGGGASYMGTGGRGATLGGADPTAGTWGGGGGGAARADSQSAGAGGSGIIIIQW